MTNAISCIIPVYNGERFIADAIQSVLDQTIAVAEIIVVDDGSSDDTKAQISAFKNDVLYVRQSNQGAVAARNHGIRIASGDYLAFLDADDLWRSKKLELQLAPFELRPRLGACTTYMQNFWMDEVADEMTVQDDDRLTMPQPGVASTLVARSGVFREVGVFDETLKHRDVQEWLIRTREHDWLVDTLPQVTVSRRVHANNISRNRSDDGDKELLRLAMASIARRRCAPGP